jgi:hypothetical protein
MGNGIEKGIVQIISWPELRSMLIVLDPFCIAITLSIYGQWRDDRMNSRCETEYGEACEMVVRSAKTIAGEEAIDMEFVKKIIELILEPGLWFWG